MPPTLWQKILAALGGLVLAILMVEIALRLVYEEPWYDALEHAQIQPLEFDLNRFGLRDRDYPTTHPPGVVRVLVLGDSFTFGNGVADDAKVFPELLEKRLNEIPLPGDVAGVEILNGGLPASLTGEWLTLYRRLRRPFAPDVVVIVFFLRDGTTMTARDTFFAPIRDRIAARDEGSALYQLSFLYRLVRDTRDRRELGERYGRRIHRAYLGSDAQTRQWRQARVHLRRIVRDVRRRDRVPALVIFPILVDLGPRYPFAEVCDEIARFGRELGVPTHDLRDAFTGFRGPELWVSAYDQHPNARAHALAAASLEGFLVDLVGRATVSRNRAAGSS